MTGEAVWKVSGVTLRQNSLSLKQDGTAELQATLEPTATNTNMTWSSIPNGIVQIIQSQTDGTKASIKPLKEGSTTVTVAAEGGQETALCNITVKAVEKKRECIAAAMPENCAGSAGIRAFSAEKEERNTSPFHHGRKGRNQSVSPQSNKTGAPPGQIYRAERLFLIYCSPFRSGRSSSR